VRHRATDDDPLTSLKVIELIVVFAMGRPSVNRSILHLPPTFLQADQDSVLPL
jgi:hypothetical protein